MPEMSMKELRNNLSRVIGRVQFGGERITLTHFGTPVAMLLPLGSSEAKRAEASEVFPVIAPDPLGEFPSEAPK